MQNANTCQCKDFAIESKKQLSPPSWNESVNLIKLSTIQTLSQTLFPITIRRSAYIRHNRTKLWSNIIEFEHDMRINCSRSQYSFRSHRHQVWMGKGVGNVFRSKHNSIVNRVYGKWMHICRETRCLEMPSQVDNSMKYQPIHAESVRNSFSTANTIVALLLFLSRLFILITKINTCGIIAMFLRYSSCHYHRSALRTVFTSTMFIVNLVPLLLRMFFVETDGEYTLTRDINQRQLWASSEGVGMGEAATWKSRRQHQVIELVSRYIFAARTTRKKKQ